MDNRTVAQEIYVQKSLHPDDELSTTMARMPYSMLVKVLALAYGNSVGMFKSDEKANTLVLSDSYQVTPDAVNPEINKLIDSMHEMTQVYDLKEEHVSTGQFCTWAGLDPLVFQVIEEYVKLFHSDRIVFYSLENPYSTRGDSEDFIATPDTVDKQWGAKQFVKPEEKETKAERKLRRRASKN
mgnify:CR=1 FL=1